MQLGQNECRLPGETAKDWLQIVQYCAGSVTVLSERHTIGKSRRFIEYMMYNPYIENLASNACFLCSNII